MKSKKIKETNESETYDIIFDKELEELKGVVLFPEKLRRTNEILKKVGLPKELSDRKSS